MISFFTVLTSWMHRKNNLDSNSENDTEVPNHDKINLALRSDEVGEIKFNPLLSIQRYEAVRKILMEHENIIKIADFGCAEGKFLIYLKKIPSVEEISLIDIDEFCCQQSSYKSKPLPFEYLFRREKSLSVKVYQGSVLKQDARLKEYDAVTCIELIEHLPKFQLEEFSQSLFFFLKPKVVIITTPNSDFNVLFPNPKTLRHWDHKFEWTRKEFETWCYNITDCYDNYNFKITQIGFGPSGTAHLGGCSQMAVFTRSNLKETQNIYEENYHLISDQTYPGKELQNNCVSSFQNESETESEEDCYTGEQYFVEYEEEIWD